MRKFILLTCLALLPAVAFSQAKVGTAVGQFLEISPSARAEGMASAFIGVADDIFAIYHNPSGLANQTSKQVALAHVSHFAGIHNEFAAFSMPAMGGVIGVSLFTLTTAKMEETTPYHPEGTGRTFTAGGMALGATYARPLTDRFSVGVNLKYVGEFYADKTANGWAMDIGTLYRTAFHDVRLGMMLSNFGPDLTFISQSFPIPMSFHFGAAGEIIKGPVHRLTLDMEGSHPNDNIEKFNIGMEYAYKEMMFLRAGYRFQSKSYKFKPKNDEGEEEYFPYQNDFASFGAGIRTALGGIIGKIDYSITLTRYTEPVHRISISMLF